MKSKSFIQKIIKKGESETIEFKCTFDNEVIESLVSFANTSGGQIVIGLYDTGAVKGITIYKETFQQWLNEIKNKTHPSIMPDIDTYNIQGKKIAILSMQEHPIKPISFKGRFYKRIKNSNHVMTIDEVVQQHLKTFNISWDYTFDTYHTINDISLDKVNACIELLNRTRDSKIADDPLSVLRKFELLRDGHITRACFLLFMKDESLLSSIEIGRFQTDTVIKDGKRIKNDLFLEIEEILAFIKKHINKHYIISGNAQREERWEYPFDALREIVINMVVHRDYSQSSDSIIKIFDNRIEFYNPGKLPEGLTVQRLLTGHYVSRIRNKQIADIFKESGLIEKYGSGIKRILESFNHAQLPPPIFKEEGNGFQVTVCNTTPQKTPQKTTLKQKIVRIIDNNPYATREVIAQTLGISADTVKEYIAKLKIEKILERIGGDKGGYWEIKRSR